jgi:hypothetical protein
MRERGIGRCTQDFSTEPEMFYLLIGCLFDFLIINNYNQPLLWAQSVPAKAKKDSTGVEAILSENANAQISSELANFT